MSILFEEYDPFSKYSRCTWVSFCSGLSLVCRDYVLVSKRSSEEDSRQVVSVLHSKTLALLCECKLHTLESKLGWWVGSQNRSGQRLASDVEERRWRWGARSSRRWPSYPISSIVPLKYRVQSTLEPHAKCVLKSTSKPLPKWTLKVNRKLVLTLSSAWYAVSWVFVPVPVLLYPYGYFSTVEHSI